MTMAAALMIGLASGPIQTKKDTGTQDQSTQPVPKADKPATRPVTATNPTDIDFADLAKRVPIVRNMRFDHPAPTIAQIEAILRVAAPRCPKGQEVWFLHVRANWKDDEGRRAVATVYFTPHKRTERLRAGHFTNAQSTLSPWQKTLMRMLRQFEESVEDRSPTRSRTVLPYWQVSRADRPFGDKLTVPDESLLPFGVPEGLTQKKVIKIVDFVRSGPAIRNAPGSYPLVHKLHDSLPIYSIEKQDDVIEILTGVQQDFLAGSGEFLRCREREDGSFEVLAIGLWYS